MKQISDARAWFRRCKRRLALPSALMGLAAFSFTLVIFGAVVYTTALPSLIAVAEQGNGILSAALLNFQGNVNQEDSGQQDDASMTPRSDSVHASGGHLSSILDMSSVISDETLGSDTADDAQDNEAIGPGAGNESGSGSNPGQGDGDNEVPEAPEIDPELEREAYEFALSEFQAVEEYIPRVNAVVESFNADCLSDLETRLTRQRECQALMQELINHWNASTNSVLLANSHYYNYARAKLAAMFRCLGAYVDDIDHAWTMNIQYADDPEAHVDEFMAPIRDAMVDGENGNLTEFRSYYEAFELEWVEP